MEEGEEARQELGPPSSGQGMECSIYQNYTASEVLVQVMRTVLELQLF